MWAVEKYSGQWDGYSGRTGESSRTITTSTATPRSLPDAPLGHGRDLGRTHRLRRSGRSALQRLHRRRRMQSDLPPGSRRRAGDPEQPRSRRLGPLHLRAAAPLAGPGSRRKSSADPERVPFSAAQIAAGVTSTATSSPTAPRSSPPFSERRRRCRLRPNLVPGTDPAPGPRSAIGPRWLDRSEHRLRPCAARLDRPPAPDSVSSWRARRPPAGNGVRRRGARPLRLDRRRQEARQRLRSHAPARLDLRQHRNRLQADRSGPSPLRETPTAAPSQARLPPRLRHSAGDQERSDPSQTPRLIRTPPSS